MQNQEYRIQNATEVARNRPASICLLHFALCIGKWGEVLVMLQSSLPTFVFDTGFTDRQPEHLPRKIRIPKAEFRKKSESRTPNLDSYSADRLGFGLRGFGLRI